MPLSNKPVGDRWKKFGGHSPISIFFNQIHPISQSVIELLDAGTFLLHVPKSKLIFKPGSEGEMLYMVLKGVARGYIVEERKEITTWINEENEVIATIRNLGLERPSEESIQAIENCDLIGMPYSLVEELYESYPEANIIGRKILEDSYRAAEERAYIARIPSAEKRYKRLIDTRPNLVNRIPLKYVASYLGITLETLSRIRNRRSL